MVEAGGGGGGGGTVQLVRGSSRYICIRRCAVGCVHVATPSCGGM